MIVGHEQETQELNEYEMEIANKLIPALRNRTKETAIKAPEIVKAVNDKWKPAPKFSEVRLRRIINYYRTNSILPVISTSNGYYVSYKEEDINLMTQSLTQRANSILSCAFGMQRMKKII